MKSYLCNRGTALVRNFQRVFACGLGRVVLYHLRHWKIYAERLKLSSFR